MTTTLRPIALAIIFCTGSLAMTALADDKPEMRTLTVTGTGRVSAPPTKAEISVGVITQAATAREALAANTESMTTLQKVLKDSGVAAKDIQTTNLNIQPQYSQPAPFQPGQPQKEFVPRIVGYQVQNTVTITARELPKLGTLLDAVVTAGANQMNGITFQIDKPEALMDVARKQAMADARKKAEILAGEAGVVVGLPISIRDEVSSPAPPPMYGRGVMAMAKAPVPIAEGEQELSVDVHVVYEIKVPQ